MNRTENEKFIGRVLPRFLAGTTARGGGFHLGHVLPWLAAVLIFVFLFWRIDLRQFYESMLKADLAYYLAWLILFSVAGYAVDAWNLHSLLFHFGHRVSFREAVLIKGVSYILLMLNYVAGMGAMLYYLRRDKNISLLRSTGLMMILNMSSRNGLLVMSCAGILMASQSTPLLDEIFISCAVLLGVFVLWIIVLKMLPDTQRINRFKDLQLVRVYHEAPLKIYALMTLERMVYYSLFIALFYIGLRTFGMEPPLLHLAIYVPIIMLVMSLPVTPFGLGTTQAAMVLFLRDFGPEAAVLAFGITYSTSLIIIRGMFGLVCLVLKKNAGESVEESA